MNNISTLLPNIIVGFIVLIILSAITYKIISDRKKGKVCGSCSCSDLTKIQSTVREIKSELKQNQ